MSAYKPYAQETYLQCDLLAQLSQSKEFIDRRFLTTQHSEANKQLAKWMVESGLDCWRDEIGNQWGRLPSSQPGAKTLIFGSHIDSVPNAGRYDGILGVLLPLALAKYCNEHGIDLPFHLELVAFGDEEGTRFGTTLISSRAVAGSWEDKWATLKDTDGVCLAQAMRDFGLDINLVGRAAKTADEVLGFIECHIEQGPVLEAKNLPVGVVTAIAGANRFQVEVIGEAGHAGTVPMNMRKDALAACAEMHLSIETIANRLGVVATVGKVQARPNAVNVICGRAEFSIDVRSLDDELKDQAVAEIKQALAGIAEKRQVTVTCKQTHAAKAVQCDEKLRALLADATQQSGIKPYSLGSGAGHDAMAMAELCPVAMLFIRCERGISHHPDEAIMVEDVEASLRVMVEFVQQLAQSIAPQAATA